MKQKDYVAIKPSLGKVKRLCVGDVSKRAANTYSKAQIETDFSIGGLIAKSYRNEYLLFL